MTVVVFSDTSCLGQVLVHRNSASHVRQTYPQPPVHLRKNHHTTEAGGVAFVRVLLGDLE